MKIALLGANGRTGRQIIAHALGDGDMVTALVRSEGSLSDVNHKHLAVIEGSPCDPACLESFLPGHDVVISSLGPRRPTRSACTIYPNSAEAIVTAMQNSNVKRLLVTSSALLFPDNGRMVRFLRWLVPNIVRGAGEMEDKITSTLLDWTITRTSFLTNQQSSGYQIGDGFLPENGNAVSRSAVAKFLLKEARDRQYSQKIVGICGG